MYICAARTENFKRMDIAIYTITSGLHDAKSVAGLTDEFLREIFPDGGFEFKGADFSDFGANSLNLIYIRTGGAEGIFKELLPGILSANTGKIYLLTSGKSNSLAASIEIFSYLRQQGIPGEILHGNGASLRARIKNLETVARARKQLSGSRIAVIGKPSDWLIASAVDRDAVKDKLGVEFVDVPIEEVSERFLDSGLSASARNDNGISDAMPGAMGIYEALLKLKEKYEYSALTLRCFDLLTSLKNTGCLALAKLNSEGVPASCEGDIPALLSMMISRALTGCTGFQANPSRIDTESGEILFAHCTISLDIPRSITYDTHFESGIGVGIHGEFPEGPVTVFKVSGDLSRAFVAEGELLRNQYEDNLCRTQIVVKLTPDEARYFLTDPIGNHHIVIPGHHKTLLSEFLQE